MRSSSRRGVRPPVFKHAILSRYPIVFASKAGSATAGGRVLFLDGYAGAGRYDDGSPGSPLLFMAAASRSEEWSTLRQVEALFVEQDPAHCTKLRHVLAEAAPQGIRFRVAQGDLGQRLPELLPLATDAAMFVFLDPFGTALDRTQLRGLLTERPRWPPTEVLLHFSVSTVARVGGLLRKAQRHNEPLTTGARKTVANVDRFLGGSWWQQRFRDVAGHEDTVTATEVALDVARQYCTMLAAETRYTSITMPVTPQPGQQPKYVLTLFTQHSDGSWAFADTLGQAGLDWLAFATDRMTQADNERREQDLARRNADQGTLFELTTEPFDRDKYEKAHYRGWEETLAANILGLLRATGDFVLADQTVEVYGALLGQAREKHVRAAVKALHKKGLVHNTGIGRRFHRKPLGPPTSAVPVPRSALASQASDPRSDQLTPDHRPSESDHPTA